MSIIMTRMIHIMVFLGVLLQALIPLGFMPGANAATPIVICSGLGEKTIYVDDNGQPVEHQQDKAEKSCAFSLTAFGMIDYPAPVQGPVSYAAETFAPGVMPVCTPIHYTLPDKTGPPAA
jgi:hypothetical protein